MKEPTRHGRLLHLNNLRKETYINMSIRYSYILPRFAEEQHPNFWGFKGA